MLIRDAMSSKVITVSARDSLQDALHLMKDHNIRRMPVLEGDDLVGMIVQNDIEKALRRPGVIEETPVEWVMARHLKTISPDENVIEAARILKDQKLSSLPVLAQGKLVGIITDADILKVFIEMMERGA
ncbi:MAG: CBS domain-containing protein [Solirubrobacterales bacterium]